MSHPVQVKKHFISRIKQQFFTPFTITFKIFAERFTSYVFKPWIYTISDFSIWPSRPRIGYRGVVTIPTVLDAHLQAACILVDVALLWRVHSSIALRAEACLYAQGSHLEQ